MIDILTWLLNASVTIFAVGSMLAVGLRYSAQEILAPLHNVRGVCVALVANFILVPLLAYGIVRILSLEPSLAAGLLLVAAAAGAPFLIALTNAAKGDLRFAASVLVLLLVGTMIYMPFAVPFVLPEATVSQREIALPLIITMLLPLGIGHALEAWTPGLAARVHPIASYLARIALIVLLVTTVLINFRSIISMFGSGAILSGVLLIGGAFCIGYLFGGGSRTRTRRVIGLGTAQRNIGAAAVVANQGIEDPVAVSMVVVTSLVGLAVLFPIAWRMAKQHAGPEEPEEPGTTEVGNDEEIYGRERYGQRELEGKASEYPDSLHGPMGHSHGGPS